MKKSRFNLMGEFQFISAEEQLGEIPLSKDIGVIAVVAMSKNYSCSRSRITDMLWSDRCDGQARASLRHSLWLLKKVFNKSSADLLQIDRKRVCLNPELCSIDVGDFLKLSESSRRVDLEQAISIYRGEFLEGLVIRDIVWDEWLGIERERLKLKYAESLSTLSEHYLAEQDVKNLIHTGRRLIDHDHLCEEGHRALMGGYTLAHQKSLALKQYERYRETIQAELNSNPEPEIQELYERIKNGEIFLNPGTIACWIR